MSYENYLKEPLIFVTYLILYYTESETLMIVL